MPSDKDAPLNPLKQLKIDIGALQDRERKWAALVQVPIKRAIDVAFMNAAEWLDGSDGHLTADQIRDIIIKTSSEGASALSGMNFGPIRITVARRVEDDCDALTILRGMPMDDLQS